MRDTLGKTKESLEFMAKVDQLTQEQRDHMRIVVNNLLDCYLNADQRATIIIGNDTEEHAVLMSVNCNDIEAFSMVSRLQNFFHTMLTADAPPKEQMN